MRVLGCVVVILASLVAPGCGKDDRQGAGQSVTGPSSPSIAATNPSAAPSGLKTTPSGPSVSLASVGDGLPSSDTREVVFPGREDAYRFRSLDLEQVYRGQLARRPFTTAVDPEGSVVWVSEYLRYRVNDCSQEEATARILAQIRGSGPPPVCGPRQQPVPDRRDALNFRRELEQTYMTVLRRTPSDQTYVDDEGDVIWTMEYLRYRLSGCAHADSVSKIMDQINGRGVPRDCTPTQTRPEPEPGPGPTPPPSPELRANFTVSSCNAVQRDGYDITCDLDASSSTPQRDITSYEWDFINGAAKGSGVRPSGVHMQCGSFGTTQGGAFRRPITLTVRSGTRSNSVTKQVDFILAGFC